MRTLVSYNDENVVARWLMAILSARGHEVHLLHLTGNQEVLQDARYHERVFASVQGIVEQRGIELFIPVFEEVFFLAARQSELRCRTLISEREVYRALHSKRAAAAFNQQHGLPFVPTLVLEAGTGREDIQRFAAGASTLVLKDDDSRGGYSARMFSSVDALWAAVCEKDRSRCVVQPVVDAPQWVVQGVFVDGVLFDHEVLEQLSVFDDRGLVRYPPYPRSADDPSAVELLEAVGRATSYRGVLEIECLGPPGKLAIMEYNPRFGGAYAHSVIAGGSFAENVVRTFTGDPLLPHASGRGVSKVEPVTKRHLRRQLHARPFSLLRPASWVRWLRLEASYQRGLRGSSTGRRRTATAPASVTSVTALDEARSPG
jgi:hypothetical protein